MENGGFVTCIQLYGLKRKESKYGKEIHLQ